MKDIIQVALNHHFVPYQLLYIIIFLLKYRLDRQCAVLVDFGLVTWTRAFASGNSLNFIHRIVDDDDNDVITVSRSIRAHSWIVSRSFRMKGKLVDNVSKKKTFSSFSYKLFFLLIFGRYEYIHWSCLCDDIFCKHVSVVNINQITRSFVWVVLTLTHIYCIYAHCLYIYNAKWA